MSGVRAILAEIELIEAVQAELAAIADRTDDRRRLDLVALRTGLADRIAAIRRLAEPFFVAHGDAALLRRFREKFSAMRTAAALHQADWPAVSLGERPGEYRASTRSVREANRAFVAWMRETLPGLE